MSTWKMPPKAKVYEALSTVADQRVTIIGPSTAQVQSSSHDKTYDVESGTRDGSIDIIIILSEG